MEEALAIVRMLFGDGPCSFAGTHYQVTELDGRPTPRQRPAPPILVGGGGRRMLGVAGRHADIVGLNVSLHDGVIDSRVGPNATAAATLEKIGWVRDAAGPRFDDIELHVRVHLAAVTDDRDAMAGALGPAFGLTPAEAIESPHALAGSVEEIVDTLVERRERFGISYLGVGIDALEPLAPVVARLAGT
jgi:probable F420-dependent oxidoreductase